MFVGRHVAVGFLALAMANGGSVIAQEQKPKLAAPAQVPIEKALSEFLTAFDNLDWQAFRTCFSSTATVFHPAAPNIRRIDSPDQFERAWLGVFERIKKASGRTSPPYMSLSPVDLRVEKLSDDVTLVTFHLIDGSTVSRRTLIFQRHPDGWKIIHLHASNITAP
jgi:ketosteroid isomerase-like protein